MSSVSEYHETAPRRVSFGWSRTPPDRIPDEPATTPVIDVPHLPLSAGERWSVKVFNEGPVPVRDPELPDGVEGFRGQGATHGVRHAHVPDHLAAQPLGTADFTRYVDFLFERLLGERPPLRAPIPEVASLRFRLAVVTATERFTAVLADWILAGAGAGEIMLGLLSRCGAEEVEHRVVAFDVFHDGGGHGLPRYARHLTGMAVSAPAMLGLWAWVWVWVCAWDTACLIGHDHRPAGRARRSPAGHNKAVRKRALPTWQALGSAVPRRPRHSSPPSREGSPSRAVEYPRRSPAARAAVA